MPDGYLTIEYGLVKLGGQLIPGLFVSMDIAGAVRFDTAEVDNISGTIKTPMGWEDALLSIELDLLTDEQSTCYEKLSQLNSIFKGMDNSSNPKVYDIVNPHTVARGVDQVVFKKLKSRESNKDDTMRATLEFDEHNPPTIPPEIRSSATDTSNPPPQAQGEAVSDPVVTADPEGAFSQGFNQGIS